MQPGGDRRGAAAQSAERCSSSQVTGGMPCKPNVWAKPLCPALVTTARLPWTHSDRTLKRRLRDLIGTEVLDIMDGKTPR
jgi:hypothetical protein